MARIIRNTLRWVCAVLLCGLLCGCAGWLDLGSEQDSKTASEPESPQKDEPAENTAQESSWYEGLFSWDDDDEGPGWFDRIFGSVGPRDKPAVLEPFEPSLAVAVLWHGEIGEPDRYLFNPAVDGDSVYAIGYDGDIARLNAEDGKQIWRIETDKPLSGGVGAGENMLAVGTPEGQVLAFGADGKALWEARLSSEVLGAPSVADATVVVRTADNRIHALDALDGRRRWTYERPVPALTLRSTPGALVAHGAVFAGFPAGKLVALDLGSGALGWEATIAQAQGATELERIVDITSQPYADSRAVYTVAYSGRLACVDLSNGNLVWARQLSSVSGLVGDARNVYVTDVKSVLHAFEKSSGASVWKQDKLFARRVSTPQVFGRYVVVGDYQGYVHFISRDDGSFVARVATDGSSIAARPALLDNGVVVQTKNGGVFAIVTQ
ncbi:MAG: outer membrane protein assembly factor BamB [Burkholderiales bacterium]